MEELKNENENILTITSFLSPTNKLYKKYLKRDAATFEVNVSSKIRDDLAQIFDGIDNEETIKNKLFINMNENNIFEMVLLNIEL